MLLKKEIETTNKYYRKSKLKLHINVVEKGN